MTIPTTLDNGTIGRLNAWFFFTFDPDINAGEASRVEVVRCFENKVPDAQLSIEDQIGL